MCLARHANSSSKLREQKSHTRVESMMDLPIYIDIDIFLYYTILFV